MKNEPWKHTPKTKETRAKIAEAVRGNKNAAKPLESHRVLVTVSVAPETARAIADLSATLGISRGKIIDRAIQNFK